MSPDEETDKLMTGAAWLIASAFVLLAVLVVASAIYKASLQ